MIKTMITKDFLSNLFRLYMDNEDSYVVNYHNSQRNSCIYKYKNSLPKNMLHSFPNSVILKVTEGCNLRCKHCFYAEFPEYYDKKYEFNTEELIELVDFLVDEINILSITLTGGEVFTRKDFIPVLKHIKEKNLVVTIQTNGTLITPDIVAELSQILNSKTDVVHISLEGADENSNDLIRGAGVFKKVINAIKSLTDSKVNVQINTTLTTISAPNMCKIFDICKELNVNLLSVSKFEVCSENQKYLELSIDEILKYSYELLTKAQDYKNIRMKFRPIYVYDFLRFPDGKLILDEYITKNDIQIPEYKCLACHRHNKITISSEGNVFFCSMDESNEAILGNLRKSDFYDIWENRYNIPYFQKRDLTTTFCKKCKYISICNTGCMASAYKKYGDINAASADCPIYESVIGEKNE